MILSANDALGFYSGEQGYLELVTEIHDLILENGFDNVDRTGVGTQGVFGRQLRFDLSKSFPLFTHKQVFMRGIFEELLWFLKGDTNIKTLLEKGVHIWSDWRYKEYLKDFEDTNLGRGMTPMTMPEFEAMIVNHQPTADKFGNIGKGYGHQWRNFGGKHPTWWNNNDGEGFDQIEWVINEIKTNPSSRRLIVSGWNPHEVGEVDLPPCHTLFQFFVRNGKLSCQLYQRSADLLLGVPFNIASYALLTHLVALECGLEVGEFVWTGGDIHIYSDQMDGLKEIMTRSPARQLPQIEISSCASIFDYVWQDINITNYYPESKVKMPVAV